MNELENGEDEKEKIREGEGYLTIKVILKLGRSFSGVPMGSWDFFCYQATIKVTRVIGRSPGTFGIYFKP